MFSFDVIYLVNIYDCLQIRIELFAILTI